MNSWQLRYRHLSWLVFNLAQGYVIINVMNICVRILSTPSVRFLCKNSDVHHHFQDWKPRLLSTYKPSCWHDVNKHLFIGNIILKNHDRPDSYNIFHLPLSLYCTLFFRKGPGYGVWCFKSGCPLLDVFIIFVT